jgi:hypothetical protein
LERQELGARADTQKALKAQYEDIIYRVASAKSDKIFLESECARNNEELKKLREEQEHQDSKH